MPLSVSPSGSWQSLTCVTLTTWVLKPLGFAMPNTYVLGIYEYGGERPELC